MPRGEGPMNVDCKRDDSRVLRVCPLNPRPGLPGFLRIGQGVGVLALLLLGCSSGGQDHARATPPIFLATGRSGTRTVTVRVAQPDGSSRVLGDVELYREPNVPISSFDYTTRDFPDASLNPSPDGLAVLFRQGLKVDILDVASASAASSLNDVGGPILWSPGGSHFIYQTDHRLLSVDRATGRVSVVVDFGDACLGGYKWSPDETRLAYLVNRDGNCVGPSELHVVAATGEDDRLVHRAATFCNGGYDEASVWSADSTHVAYVVTSIPLSADRQPLNGTVAFYAASITGSASSDGSGVRPSAMVELPSSDYSPMVVMPGSVAYATPNAETTCEWSPRTNWLALSGRDLHVLRADGSDRRIFESSRSAESVALVGADVWWSPDGERLGRYDHDGLSFRLRTFSPSSSGSASAELDVKLRYPCCSELTWSADGQHAMYVIDDEGSAVGQIPLPQRIHLWHAESGSDENLGDQSVGGFNAEGTRLFYGFDASPDTRPRLRPVEGGRTVRLPSAARGWASENAVVIVRD